MVETGQADITKTGGEDMYRAFADFNGLYPFASEDYQNGPAGVEYSPIMLVPRARHLTSCLPCLPGVPGTSSVLNVLTLE